MEEFAKTVVLPHDETKKASQTISIFIINAKNEMLLHKKTHHHDQTKISWQPPCFLHHDQSIKPTTIARHYVDQLGITCELHEAFMLNAAASQCNTSIQFSNHLIIAIASNYNKDLNNTSEVYEWATINNTLNGVHEHHAAYALWLGTALEGVQLYVKNIFVNRSVDNIPLH